MKEVSVGIIGTGWCGGIRAEACSASPFVRELHIAEIREDRLKEVAGKTKPVTATTDSAQRIRMTPFYQTAFPVPPHVAKNVFILVRNRSVGVVPLSFMPSSTETTVGFQAAMS